jgi:hypothetical protein
MAPPEEDRSHLGSKFVCDKSDSYAYSTYSARDMRAQPLPVRIPEAPVTYYGHETLPRDHMYEYPAFVGSGPKYHPQRHPK